MPDAVVIQMPPIPVLVTSTSSVGLSATEKIPTADEIATAVSQCVLHLSRCLKLPEYHTYLWEYSGNPCEEDMIWHEVKRAHKNWKIQLRHVRSALKRLHGEEEVKRRRDLVEAKKMSVLQAEKDHEIVLRARTQKGRAQCQARLGRIFGLRRALLAVLDVSTDIGAVVTYFQHGHMMWGVLSTLFLIGGIVFLPLIIYTSAVIALSSDLNRNDAEIEEAEKRLRWLCFWETALESVPEFFLSSYILLVQSLDSPELGSYTAIWISVVVSVASIAYDVCEATVPQDGTNRVTFWWNMFGLRYLETLVRAFRLAMFVASFRWLAIFILIEPVVRIVKIVMIETWGLRQRQPEGWSTTLREAIANCFVFLPLKNIGTAWFFDITFQTIVMCCLSCFFSAPQLGLESRSSGICSELDQSWGHGCFPIAYVLSCVAVFVCCHMQCVVTIMCGDGALRLRAALAFR